MKKKLEADLMSIAHRILKLKNKSDVNQLYLETQKLYEKLALLRLVEEHFSSKTTIEQGEIEPKIQAVFNAIDNNFLNEINTEVVDAGIPRHIYEEKEEEELTQIEKPFFEESDNMEEAKELKTSFIPLFELEKKEELVSEIPKQSAVEISFEDLIGGNFNEDLFVKAENQSFENQINTGKEAGITENSLLEIELPQTVKDNSKPITLNEKLSRGISIDLNDRIAFTKHLFGNSTLDYNRVLNQLITFDSFDETCYFIKNMVKPDYNNWKGKEEYEERFMEIIEKKFL
jgi:hypothetical protein